MISFRTFNAKRCSRNNKKSTIYLTMLFGGCSTIIVKSKRSHILFSHSQRDSPFDNFIKPMQNRCMGTKGKKDWAKLWKPGKESKVSLYKAAFQTFSFKKHSHEDYAIGVIEDGTQQFYLGGANRVAPVTSMIAVNPGEVHDGRSASPNGYRYRVAYFNHEMLREILFGLYENRNRMSYFKAPVVFEKKIARRLVHALDLMEGENKNLLAAQTLLMQVIAEVFLRYGEERRSPKKLSRNRAAVKKAAAYIRSSAPENISLYDIAKVAGLSPYHFLRQFKATTGLPPHAYLMQCRVYLARQAVDKGNSLTDAALDAGFSDLPHFSRCFKAIHGLTPGQYQRSLYSRAPKKQNR
jgi:AraC-like DNA-binding protein